MADRKLYDCIPMPIGLVEFRERDEKGDRMVCIEAQYLVDLYGEVADGKVLGVVRCKDCKHRPIYSLDYEWIEPPKEDITTVSDLLKTRLKDDRTCPCLCDDECYSHMPEDDFFCAYGELKGDTK